MTNQIKPKKKKKIHYNFKWQIEKTKQKINERNGNICKLLDIQIFPCWIFYFLLSKIFIIWWFYVWFWKKKFVFDFFQSKNFCFYRFFPLWKWKFPSIFFHWISFFNNVYFWIDLVFGLTRYINSKKAKRKQNKKCHCQLTLKRTFVFVIGRLFFSTIVNKSQYFFFPPLRKKNRLNGLIFFSKNSHPFGFNQKKWITTTVSSAGKKLHFLQSYPKSFSSKQMLLLMAREKNKIEDKHGQGLFFGNLV